MSVSHGYSTIGGIEYGRGCEEETKKEKVSHQLGKLMGYEDAHQSISMQVSRDFHAMDALELQVYESSTKETKWVCIKLACSRRPRAFWGSPSLEYTSQVL